LIRLRAVEPRLKHLRISRARRVTKLDAVSVTLADVRDRLPEGWGRYQGGED